MLFWLQFIANRPVVEGGIELAKKAGIAVGAAIIEVAEKATQQQKQNQQLGSKSGIEPPQSEGRPPKPP